ncbi:MAG: TerD family protein [bacterium]
MAINLSKGQTISLKKDNDAGLTKIRMGVGWDPVKKSGFFGGLFGGNNSIDLDASCVIIDNNRQPLDAVWFSQLESRDGAIRHSGDNLTGDGEGDDEVIFVDLTSLPDNVKYLVFTVNSFRGQTFDEVENAFCRLVDDTNNKEMARLVLSEKGAHTGLVMSVISRNGGTWEMRAVGHTTTARTINDMLGDIDEAL